MSPNHYHKIIVPKFGVCFTIVWLVFDGLCYIFFFMGIMQCCVAFSLSPILSINISWKNGKLHGITALVINFLTSNQLLVNINQLFETLEEKK